MPWWWATNWLRVGEAINIARDARGIALQSVVAGMALSIAGMAFAALGALPPVAGAIFQEAIDVVVVLNALRALGVGGLPTRAGRSALYLSPAPANPSPHEQT